MIVIIITIATTSIIIVINDGIFVTISTSITLTIAVIVTITTLYHQVRSVASKTNDVAGDGTTTATILTRAIYAEGCKVTALPSPSTLPSPSLSPPPSSLAPSLLRAAR
jgi:hypothetical protein